MNEQCTATPDQELYMSLTGLGAKTEREHFAARRIQEQEKRIKEIELDLGLAEIALRHKTELLESCEAALIERDAN